MGAVIAGIAVSTLVSAISGYMGAQAQAEAYETLAKASKEERAEFQKAYDQAYGENSYNAKMQELGAKAQQTYYDMVNDTSAWNKYISGDKAYVAPEAFTFTQEDFTDDPSYQVRLNEGLDALEQSLLASGYSDSGYAAKAINNYAQDQASKEYAAAYGRAYDKYKDQRDFDYNAWKNEAGQYYQNLTNRLSGLDNISKTGATASQAQATALSALAGNNASSIAQQTTAQAAADQSKTSQITSILDAIAKGVNTGAGLYASQAGSNVSNTTEVDSNYPNIGTSYNSSMVGTTGNDYSEAIERLLKGYSDSANMNTNTSDIVNFGV